MWLPRYLSGFDEQRVSSSEEFERTSFSQYGADFSFLDTEEKGVATWVRHFGLVKVLYTETSGHRIVQRGEGRLSACAILGGTLFAQANDTPHLMDAGQGAFYRSSSGRSQVGIPGTSALVISWPEPSTPLPDEGRNSGILSRTRGRRIHWDVLEILRALLGARTERLAVRRAALWTARMTDRAQAMFETEGGYADAPLKAGGLRQVRRAEEMMQARLSDSVTIAEIAAALGLTPRALQGAFLRYRDRTPHQQLQLMRLAAAYRKLRNAGPDEHVGDIAADCGIFHPGRFASAYGRVFGEHPSQTLDRSRARSA